MPPKHTPPPSGPPLPTSGYAALAILGLSVAIAATWFWVTHQAVLGSQAPQVFYVVLVVLGLGVALLLFGVLHSSASLTGSYLGYKVSLGGPAAATALVVGAGVWLGQPPSTYNLGLSLIGEGVGEVPFAHNDSLSLRAGQFVATVLPTAQGDAFVNGLASNLRTVSVILNSQTFRIKTPENSYKVPSSNELTISVELIDPRTLVRYRLANQFDQVLEVMRTASDAKGQFVFPHIDAYLAGPSKERWAVVVADVDASMTSLRTALQRAQSYDEQLSATMRRAADAITSGDPSPQFTQEFKEARAALGPHLTVDEEILQVGADPPPLDKVRAWKAQLEDNYNALQSQISQLSGELRH